MRKAQDYTKASALKHWIQLKENLNVLKHFYPLPYKTTGSKYGACTIRISGNPEFVDAVLSRLKDLTDAENSKTRLNLSRTSVKPTEINGVTKSFENADDTSEVCYISCQARGPESQIMHERYMK